MDLRTTDAWKQLDAHRARIADVPVRQLFADDPERAARLSLRMDDLLADFSKQRVTPETITLLARLAREAGVEAARDRMFSGAPINLTEGRAVLHTALRRSAPGAFA